MRCHDGVSQVPAQYQSVPSRARMRDVSDHHEVPRTSARSSRLRIRSRARPPDFARSGAPIREWLEANPTRLPSDSAWNLLEVRKSRATGRPPLARRTSAAGHRRPVPDRRIDRLHSETGESLPASQVPRSPSCVKCEHLREERRGLRRSRGILANRTCSVAEARDPTRGPR